MPSTRTVITTAFIKRLLWAPTTYYLHNSQAKYTYSRQILQIKRPDEFRRGYVIPPRITQLRSGYSGMPLQDRVPGPRSEGQEPCPVSGRGSDIVAALCRVCEVAPHAPERDSGSFAALDSACKAAGLPGSVVTRGAGFTERSGNQGVPDGSATGTGHLGIHVTIIEC